MKTIVVYFSKNAKMEKLSNLARDHLLADISEIQAIPSKIPSNKFMKIFDKLIDKGILPIENNVSDYENIVILAPIYKGYLAEEICLFIRGYSLSDKRVYCVMCYEGNMKDSEEKLSKEFEEQDINCYGMIEINMQDDELLEKISKKEKILYIDKTGIYLRGKKEIEKESKLEKTEGKIATTDKENCDDTEIDFSYNYRMSKESQKNSGKD